MAAQGLKWRLTVVACGVLALAPAANLVAAQRETPRVAVPRTGQASQAYEAGLREGARQGELDGRNGRDGHFELDAVYRAGDRGYTRTWGDREAYRAEFRRGFTIGYRQSYDRFRVRQDRREDRQDRREVRRDQRWPRGYQEPAAARGYDDGYGRGRDDGRDRDRYDPARHGDYRSADEGYQREYGSRDTYKNNYRAGFRQGYEDGYRDGGRR